MARPRFQALTEFGPQNIVYHNGNKYRVTQLTLPNLKENSKRAKASKISGYFFMDDEYLA
jgi:hypothetical protein